MLAIVTTSQFKRDVKLIIKRNKDYQKLNAIVDDLKNKKVLPPKNKNHKLKGFYADCWECHIEPDWLLIYEKSDTMLLLLRTGSHSDLF